MLEPLINEYGFADYGTGDYAIPSSYLFDEEEYSETVAGGDTEPEYWKEVAPGYYISNCGNLYSFKSKKILKTKQLDSEGHVGYCIYSNGHRIYKYQHRLLGEEFLHKADSSYNIVRHLNDIPNDNDLNNLAWGTQADNWKDSLKNGTIHALTPEERELGLKKLRKPVLAANLNTGDIYRFRSLNDAVVTLGVQQSNACKVLKGERKHTCGWKFEYI